MTHTATVCLQECIDCGSTIYGIYDELGFEPEPNHKDRPSAVQAFHTDGRYKGREKGWRCMECVLIEEAIEC